MHHLNFSKKKFSRLWILSYFFLFRQVKIEKQQIIFDRNYTYKCVHDFPHKRSLLFVRWRQTTISHKTVLIWCIITRCQWLLVDLFMFFIVLVVLYLRWMIKRRFRFVLLPFRNCHEKHTHKILLPFFILCHGYSHVTLCV